MSLLRDLDTPALILDRGVMESNLRAMAARAAGLGVALRPHLKTAKCAEVATLAVRGQPGGLTVATLAEAEFFAGHGFRDLTYAVGITPHKLERAARLRCRGVDLRILTDDPDVARSAGDCADRAGTEFPVLVEVDCGAHRGGLTPDAARLEEVARVLHDRRGTRLEGVLTHAGHAYLCGGPERIVAVAEQERRAAVSAAERLRAAGLPCPVVSVGSTPTAVFAESLAGVTEIRPGNFMFFDLFQESLGVCRREQIALSVLASVIGCYPDSGRVLIDAGALALSQDTGANRLDRSVGYGIVLDVDARRLSGDPRVKAVHQEHGFVDYADAGRLPVGTRVRVLPNHSCTTAAMFDRYHVVDGSDEVIDRWKRARGW